MVTRLQSAQVGCYVTEARSELRGGHLLPIDLHGESPGHAVRVGGQSQGVVPACALGQLEPDRGVAVRPAMEGRGGASVALGIIPPIAQGHEGQKSRRLRGDVEVGVRLQVY